MFRDTFQPPQEARQLGIRAFIGDVEGDLRNREKYGTECAPYRTYFESLGGSVISTLPLAEGTHAVAKTYSPLNKMGYIEPVDPLRPIKRTVIREYPIADILSHNPQYPDFWQRVAIDGIVSKIVYSQSPHGKPEEEKVITIGEGGDVIFPNALVELKDSTVRIFFIDPEGSILLWPHCIAQDTFAFVSVPKVIDRAFSVYNNACETRRRPLFFDVDPSHANYHHRFQTKRIAIEYTIEQPNRMRPVEVEV